MADTKWTIKGREFVNCNCSYGCPCQFNGLRRRKLRRSSAAVATKREGHRSPRSGR